MAGPDRPGRARFAAARERSRCAWPRWSIFSTGPPVSPSRAGSMPKPFTSSRIWTRRASAALRLFRELLGRRQARWLKKKLRQVRHTAGEVRDCDVLLARLPTQSNESLATLVHQIQARRRAALKALIRLHERLIGQHRLRRHSRKLLHKAACNHKSPAAKEPFGPWYRRQMKPLAAEFFRQAQADPARSATLHELRIAGQAAALRAGIGRQRPSAGHSRQAVRRAQRPAGSAGDVCDHLAGSIGSSSGSAIPTTREFASTCVPRWPASRRSWPNGSSNSSVGGRPGGGRRSSGRWTRALGR